MKLVYLVPCFAALSHELRQIIDADIKATPWHGQLAGMTRPDLYGIPHADWLSTS